ncbi:hypothetical protein A7P95_02450 [Eikenella longinqua]|uniref:DUF695 domain-containing protein n=1 Tax=Eikenella longinqua TaxID=1795827 RepID=A0A1A9S0N3_9NEIS|nr:hypothetical protein [Eikenella longinqua]OAM30878.1 hypothetical protein A7P95_02450 [Eikenella longinqua]
MSSSESGGNARSYRVRLDELNANARCFWADWQQEEARLAALADAVAFVTEANELLQRHCPEVVVELDGEPANGALVFSANGVIARFPQVLALVAEAAEGTQRSVVCFRQRVGASEQFAIRMNGVDLRAADILVRCEEWQGLPALEMAFAAPPKEEDKAAVQHLAIIMLDHVLGEWDAVVKVGALDFVDAVPPDAVPLNRLPEKLDEVWKALGRDALYPEPEWEFAAYQCDEDEEAGRDALVLLRNESANGLLGRADMGWVVSVQCSIDGEEGLTAAYQLQDELDAEAAHQQQGIVTLSVTNLTRGERTVFAATGEPERLAAKAQEICARFAQLKPQVDCEYDPNWRHYRF